MRRIFFAVLFFAFIINAYSQTTQPFELTKTDYLKKAKTQKIAAWVSLGGGIAMIITGASININSGWGEENKNKGLWLSYVGGATSLVSIPLFISARKNKKRQHRFNNESSISVL